MIKLVIVESPYSGAIEKNTEYAQRAVSDCIDRGETPFASHLFYPQVLNEDDESERDCGINLGLEIGKAFRAAEVGMVIGQPQGQFSLTIAFYVDNGWSRGMEEALGLYSDMGCSCEIRRIGKTGVIDKP